MGDHLIGGGRTAHAYKARAEAAEVEAERLKSLEIDQTNYLSAELNSAEARVAELEAALRTAHYWMQLGFKGEAQHRAGAGEADAEVRAALTGFPHGLKGQRADIQQHSDVGDFDGKDVDDG